MENINDIIASLTPDDIQSLKETARAIFGDDADGFTSQSSKGNPFSERKSAQPFGSDFSSMFNPEMLGNIGRIMSLMNNENGKRANLIEALKPNLSLSRQKKADEAMQILKLLELMPMIAELTKRGD